MKHCIQTVWVHKQLPPDNSSVCQICLDMVKQARDQLESNETQVSYQTSKKIGLFINVCHSHFFLIIIIGFKICFNYEYFLNYRRFCDGTSCNNLDIDTISALVDGLFLPAAEICFL